MEISMYLSMYCVFRSEVHGNFHVPCDETYGKVHATKHTSRYMEISMYLEMKHMARYMEISTYVATKHMARYIEISMYLMVTLTKRTWKGPCTLHISPSDDQLLN